MRVVTRRNAFLNLLVFSAYLFSRMCVLFSGQSIQSNRVFVRCSIVHLPLFCLSLWVPTPERENHAAVGNEVYLNNRLQTDQ